MRFRIIAVFLPGFIALVNGFDLKCTATTGQVAYISNINYCRVQSATITSQNETITSVNGATTPTTFQGIGFTSLTVHYLPKGLGTFFPKLRELGVNSCGLKSIQAADLENLTALESVYANGNAIEELSSDLFQFTPNIKHVDFSSGHLARVGKDFLTNLKSLSRLRFTATKCINSETTSDFETLKSALRTQCPDPKELKEKFCSEDFKRYEKKISDLETVIEKQNLDLTAKILQIRHLEAEIIRMKKNCYNGLLDSATKILHSESARLKKCSKSKTNIKVEDGPEIVLHVMNTTETQISIGITVASPESKIEKILDASGNEVQPNHTELIIDQQSVLFLPVNFGQFFTSLQRLSVTFSGLYGLDSRTFAKMNNLFEVNFTANKIVEIPEAAFSALTSLKTIDLSYNNIEIISENAFKANANLEIVKLNHNKLASIDSQLFHSHGKLQKLFLNDNKLKYINAKLWSSSNVLKVIDFSRNTCIDMMQPNNTLKEIETKILNSCIAPVEITCKDDLEQTQVTDTDCEAEALTLVYPGTRLLIADHDNEERIEKLSVIDQKILFLPFKLSETLPHLVQLIVKQSQLTTLQKTDFEGMSLLQEITITGNNVSLIEEGVFDAVPLIIALNLANNNIELLPPKAFAKLMKMRVLILKGNQLKKFTVSLLPPRRNVIKDLQLQENQLEFIESKVLRLLRNAEQIDFSGNECVDMKYQKSDKSGKTLKDLLADVDLECSDHSAEYN